MAKENAKFHGYRIEEATLAKMDLGQRKFDEFMNARRRTLMGLEIPPEQNAPNLPFKTANDRKWSPEIRYLLAWVGSKIHQTKIAVKKFYLSLQSRASV